VLFCASIAPAAADGEWELIQGGKPCQLNVECGIPSANLQTERERTASITGACSNGVCVCVETYGCQNCGVSLDQGTTVRSWLSAPFDEEGIDLCSVQWGGGVCAADSDCYHGLCIAGKCVCYSGWTCPYCELDANGDIRKHAQCGQYNTGGKQCQTAGDCNNNGLCTAGVCECSAGWACEDCQRTQEDIVNGVETCDCPEDHCNGHGTCEGGTCTCDPDYSGAQCTVDVCEDVNCNNHGDCVHGECQCDSGYLGPNCDLGGDTCVSNADCGKWAPIAMLPGEENRECEGGYTCVENKYGGSCISGKCVCNAGFACGDCRAKGEGSCKNAAGGGPCVENTDCKPEGAEGTGGFCWKQGDAAIGRCICYAGFSCPRCDIAGALSPGQQCPVFDPKNARGGAPCSDNEDCGLFKTGTGGTCRENGFCECFSGYYCPTCNTLVEEGEEPPECTPPHVGSATCGVHGECGHGVCMADPSGPATGAKVCVCNGGWACDHCEGRIYEPGTLRKGKCKEQADCGSDELIGGECVDGICECYPGFICSHCQLTENGGQSCPATDYWQEGDEVECPVRVGGAPCPTEGSGCGLLPSGSFGGLCSVGACSCYGGFTCPDCSKTFEEIVNGAVCPEIFTAAPRTAALSPAAVALAALAMAAAVALKRE